MSPTRRPAEISRRSALKLAGASAALFVGRGCRRFAHEPGTLTVLVNAEPEHLDPRFPGDALGSTLSRLVYSSLLDSDPINFEPRLLLATSFELQGQGQLRVVLRDDARFDDGTSVSADDVAATFNAVLDASVASTLRGTYGQVFESARVVDRRTVEFVLTGPNGTFPSLLQLPILRARDTRLRELVAQPGAERAFVGSGAMRVASLERGAWRLERRQPVAGRANVVRVLTMHDPNTLALRLLHGGADVAELKPELFELFDGRAGFQLGSARSVGFTYLGMRNDHPALAIADVRRAIAMGIDRDALRSGKFGRFAVASTGPLPPTHWAFNGDVRRYDFDPQRAREMLDRALPSPRGGELPRARLLFRVSNVRFALTAARAIAEMLTDLGFDVELRPSELAVLLTDLRAGRYDITLLTMPDLSDPWGLAWLFSSSAQPTAANPRAGGNRWRYTNPALDAALDEGRRAIGTESRRPAYARAQAILADDLPVVPLWHADIVYAAGPRVRSITPRGDAQLDFLLDAPLAPG